LGKTVSSSPKQGGYFFFGSLSAIVLSIYEVINTRHGLRIRPMPAGFDQQASLQ
jgi:hypothetical protein